MVHQTLPEDTAPVDRFCDLVMKGGITSGVVYPLAILELARSYRFKNIGGTSAGAIAAAVTAAAEYRRRNGSMAGFEVLGALPAKLGETVGGRSRLLSLFQPEASTARLFKALLSALNRESTATRWFGALLGFLEAYAWPAVGGAALGLLVHWAAARLTGQPSIVLALLLAVIGALGGLAAGVCRDVVRGLVPNGFGLCKCGPSLAADAATPALVPWLHRLIQETAGRAPADAPLTFADLWAAPDFPPPWLPATPGKPVRSINLQVFTSNLTHGRPYHLPLEDQSSRLFFRAKELSAYFPGDVIAHMVKHGQSYAGASLSDGAPNDAIELPCGELPIVVAARLSLSFPILISAVPLWAVDEQAPLSRQGLKQCWFSDGGICSNFPIHLFDGLLPMWPTFGITLGKRSLDQPHEATSLPNTHEEGRADVWNRFADKPDALAKLGGFLASIVTTAQTWNDATSSRMPGVRDRVVQVRLQDDEGGLNLNMSSTLIAGLAGHGKEAGAKLRAKFAPPPASAGPTRGWREHRWVRFNVLLTALRERLGSLPIAANQSHHAAPLRAEIQSAIESAPLHGDGSGPLTARQAESLAGLLTALEAIDRAFSADTTPQPYRPVPEPSIRVRTPL